MGAHTVDVLTGVNLPMLLKVFSSRDKDLFELSALGCDAGKKGIVAAGEMLRSKVTTG
jgi:PTS system mannose-specific IIA component